MTIPVGPPFNRGKSCHLPSCYFECHILEQEDLGMMGKVVVVADNFP